MWAVISAYIVSNVIKSSDSTDKDNCKDKEEIKNNTSRSKKQKPKFSYNEKREFEKIDSDIEAIETKIDKIDLDIEANSSDYTKLQELMEEKEKLEDELLSKLERQEYFEDLEKEIEEYK